jgi:hypothetical protein
VAFDPGAFAFGFIAEGIKRLREKRRRKRADRRAERDAAGGEFFEDDKETPVFQGKLTYASVAVLALSWLAQRFDVPLLPEDAESIVAALLAVAGTIGGVYGRWRATKA